MRAGRGGGRIGEGQNGEEGARRTREEEGVEEISQGKKKIREEGGEGSGREEGGKEREEVGRAGRREETRK